MENKLINRVAKSGLLTINLEEFYPKSELCSFDLKDYLFHGLILKEKEFRQALKDHDWSIYTDKHVFIHCSSDAIIPTWAYMLVASGLYQIANSIYQGTEKEFLNHYYCQVLKNIDYSQYEGKKIVIKGCSNKPVPIGAYVALTNHLKLHALSIMYGEPCSTVPIYKKSRLLKKE